MRPGPRTLCGVPALSLPNAGLAFQCISIANDFDTMWGFSRALQDSRVET
jgi:hypothetical protein